MIHRGMIHPWRAGLTRRQLLEMLGWGALALAGPSWSSCQPRARRTRPNIVLIVGDDHRHDALSCAGHPWIRTPALDRLANDGVRFTNAFVTTSLCSPSRASILTGLYAHAHGVTRNEDRDVPAHLPTLPILLRQAGYRTAFIGKWHMARSARARPGFEHWVSFNGQGEYPRNTFNVDGNWELSREYVTDVLTDYAIRYLEQQREAPFFLMLAHKAVHAPFWPAQRHAGLYSGVNTAVITQEATRPGWPSATFDMRDYARTLAALDESVGAVLDRLAARRLLDNTLVVYASDNGFLAGERGGLLDKRVAFEPAIRIPLLMRWPGSLPQGVTCDELALNIDLAPTLLSAAGATSPPPMHGVDLAALQRDEAQRGAFLYEYFSADSHVPPILALRTKEWKYVTYPANPELPIELYQLKDDPREEFNRATEASYSDLLPQMQAELLRLWYASGAAIAPEQLLQPPLSSS